MNAKGQLIPAKYIKVTNDCKNTCKFNCNTKVSKENQEKIFSDFYSLDNDAKRGFIIQTTSFGKVSRTTVKNEMGSKITSRRKGSYSYFLSVGEQHCRVCKSFYLATLAVSQKAVYTAHQKKDPVSGTLTPDGRGKHNNMKKIGEEQRTEVIDHINSFQLVDSHYCRAKTNKKYIEATLNLAKMYDLYKAQCLRLNEEPVKQSFYRYIYIHDML